MKRMARSLPDVTETELAVLQVLWDLGTASVRQVVERLYPDGGPTAPPTVNKLLGRLESKRFVKRDKSGGIQTFRATVDRAALVSARLRSVAETLCDGSLTSLVTHLVQTESLSKSDRQALRALVNEWDDIAGPNERPGR
jgi:BlaI family transcriptional regulator, penicillinase repressor